MQLSGRVALITGGGTGIGAGIARAFAEAGAQVIIVGRRLEPLQETVAQIGSERVRPLALDVSDRAAVQQHIAALLQEYGKIDIVVNNAGINIPKRRMAELDAEDWDAVLEVNATGPFNVIHAVLPSMRERRDGLFITISSIAGYRPSVLGGAAYSASKSAVMALTQVLALEEAENGIRATNIYPGEVATPLLDKRAVPVTPEQRAKMLQPEDVAAAALFVACLPPRAAVPELMITPSIKPTA
mgnify:CR=1 FL=1|jgi:NADP-dependent 3-hydroxy acid dehydrogenase YdfG